MPVSFARVDVTRWLMPRSSASMVARARARRGGSVMNQTAAFVGLYDTHSKRSTLGRLRIAVAALALIATWVLAGCTSASMESPRSGGPGSTVAGTTVSGSTGAGGQGPGTGKPGEWCSVLSVLRDNCQGCHAATPLFGAPMP